MYCEEREKERKFREMKREFSFKFKNNTIIISWTKSLALLSGR